MTLSLAVGMSPQNVELAKSYIDAFNRRDLDTLRALNPAGLLTVRGPQIVLIRLYQEAAEAQEDIERPDRHPL